MTYINDVCADVGTANCPCPLAETGDCLICSRLAGKDSCDCGWAGVCIYNEFMQNDKLVRNRRKNALVPILKKTWYGNDVLVLVLKVSRGLALKCANPGSFVFLNTEGSCGFANVPISVMKADAKNGRLYLAVKIISVKTKAIAEAESVLVLRGVYRNGLIGTGVKYLADDVKAMASREKKWLILTKGIGFAPAVNLLGWTKGRVTVDMLVDTEKVGQEITGDFLDEYVRESESEINVIYTSLENAGRCSAGDYDKVIILASDYYIKNVAQQLEVPARKLIFSNNFHICCGEGVCGACGHTDSKGNVSKMCKCSKLDLKELI